MPGSPKQELLCRKKNNCIGISEDTLMEMPMNWEQCGYALEKRNKVNFNRNKIHLKTPCEPII